MLTTHVSHELLASDADVLGERRGQREQLDERVLERRGAVVGQEAERGGDAGGVRS